MFRILLCLFLLSPMVVFSQELVGSFSLSPAIDQIRVLRPPTFNFTYYFEGKDVKPVIDLSISPLIIVNQLLVRIGAVVPVNQDGMTLVALAGGGSDFVLFAPAQKPTLVLDGGFYLHQKLLNGEVALDFSVGITLTQTFYLPPPNILSTQRFCIPLGIGIYF